MAVGHGALAGGTAAYANVAIGDSAANKLTTGTGNVFVGDVAGQNATAADGTVAVGRFAGSALTTGDANTFVGRLAGSSNDYSDDNAAFGFNAGATVVGSGRNTLLGSGADVANANVGTAIAIGYNAIVGNSSTMAFGNFNKQQWVFGRSTAGSANYALQVGDPSLTVNGNGAYLTRGGVWTNVSDINLKENIQPIEGSQVLSLIRQLPLSRWTYKGTEGETHLGPMAQDFYRLFHLGLNDTSISTVDPAGVALAGV